MEDYRIKQQETTSEKVKVALYSLLTNCINNFKKMSAARELEPPIRGNKEADLLCIRN